MLYPDYNYVEVAFNGAKNRNQVLHVDDVLFSIPFDGVDNYQVMFRYTEDLKHHTDKNKTIKGHGLAGYPDFISFDIDRDNDIDGAKKDTFALLNELYALGISINNVDVYFSGMKGFHIQIPSSLFGVEPDVMNAVYMRALCKKIAGDIKIDASIYDMNRLFRINNTKHGKSGLYKVLLPPEMLMGSSEDIFSYASMSQSESVLSNDWATDINLSQMWQDAKASIKKTREINKPINKEITVPKNEKACIYRILAGVENGKIHNSSLRLANHYHKQGLHPNVIRGILEGWGPLNDIPAQEDFERMAIEAGQYDFGCNDEILKEYCNEKCYLFKKDKINPDNLMDIYAQKNVYAAYVKNLNKKRFITGFEPLDERIRGIAPGQLMVIQAYSGLFKSALLQNLLLSACKRNGLHHLFFSLEMPVIDVFERTVQITSEIENYKIERFFQCADDSVDHMMKDLKLKNADKMIVCPKSGLTLDVIEKYIELAKEKYGEIGAVGIDYLGLINGKGESTEDKISKIANGCKEIAKNQDIPTLLLCQVNRNSLNADIEMNSAKGSGGIEAAADYMLGLQRKGEEVELRLLKSRKSSEKDYKVTMDAKYLKFISLEEIDKKAQKSSVSIRKKVEAPQYIKD